MISDIEERLVKMGLFKSPFLEYDPKSSDFSRIFIDRTKELYKMNLALEYYRTQSNRNIAFVGPSRIGKTTLLHYIIMRVQEEFRCIYFNYPLRFNEFCKKGLDFFEEGVYECSDVLDSRDLGNRFIECSTSDPANAIFFIDNFEEILHFPDDEVDGFIRLFRRAKILFIVACTEEEWGKLLSKHPRLKYAFVEEIFIPAFSLKSCMEFFQTRLAIARREGVQNYQPFTEDAVRLIGVYSFFIPGRINDLANRALFEALTEDMISIDADFVRKLVFSSPVTGGCFLGLNENEITTIEIMIEKNCPVSFEELAGVLGVSRVAVAGYIQKLIERKIAIQLDTPGKKKLFQITDFFRRLLV